MTCATIMNPAPHTVGENETIGSAAALMVEYRVSRLPVIDGNGRLLGVFGIDNLLALLMPQVAMASDLVSNLRFMADDPEAISRRFAQIKNSPVRRAIDRDPPIVHPDTPVMEAIRLFSEGRLKVEGRRVLVS